MSDPFIYNFLLQENEKARKVNIFDNNLTKNIYQWTHFDIKQAQTSKWLQSKKLDLNKNIRKSLVSEETRPRILENEKGILLILRGVNLNNNSDPEDMVSIRLWVEKRRIISSRRRKLKSIDDIVAQIEKKATPKNTSDFVCTLIEKIYLRIYPIIEELDKKIENYEDDFLLKKYPNTLSEITDIHITSSIFLRYLEPQERVLQALMKTEKKWFDTESKSRIEELHNQFKLINEELKLIIDRASILKDEIAFIQNNRLNKNLYFLSIITGVFLPLTFLTGLFGVNLEGIPNSDSGLTFLAFCLILFLFLIIELILLRKVKWL